MISLEPRETTSFWTPLRSISLAIVITLIVAALVLLAMSDKPLDAIWQMLTFPWQARRFEVQLGLVLQQTAYLATIAIGLAVGYRANVWNIGAEGQFALGSIFAYLAYLGRLPVGTHSSQLASHLQYQRTVDVINAGVRRLAPAHVPVHWPVER